MTEKERVLKKAKTKKKLHALNTKSQDVTRKLRNDVNKGVNDICEKV